MDNFYQRAALKTKLPGEALPGQPLMEIIGDKRVLIENHCGVCGYDLQRIQVKVNYGCVIIHGRNLELMQMTRDQLVITGSITGVELLRGEDSSGHR